jgi:hypothetical protein
LSAATSSGELKYGCLHGSQGVARVLPMKKLLALSIALLSLNLYGADKPIYSYDGLEGWGKEKGVHILVEDYSVHDKTFDVKAIKNQVELKLRLAGIKIVKNGSSHHLIVNMQPIMIRKRNVGYSLRIEPTRRTTFKYNGKEYVSDTSRTISYGGILSDDYRPALDGHLDRLLLDYLKANPKPKEKKSLIEP